MRPKGPVRGLQSSTPRHTTLGGQGVLPWWSSVRPEGPARGLQSSRPGHTSLGGQRVLPRRWSLRPKGPAKGAAVCKARAHQPGGTGSPALAVVGASSRAPEGDCSMQGPGTPPLGDKGSCPVGGRYVLKGLRGSCSLQGPGTPARGDKESRLGGGQCVLKGL